MFVCFLPNSFKKNMSQVHFSKVSRVSFGHSQREDSFERTEFKGSFFEYMNNLAEKNPESKKILPILLNAKEKGYKRFVASEMSLILGAYKDETKNLFSYLLKEKDGDKYRFTGFGIEKCLGFANKQNQKEIKELLSQKDKNGFVYSVLGVEFLMNTEPSKRDFAKQLITYNSNTKQQFEVKEAKHLMQIITDENKDVFDILLNSKSKKNPRFAFSDISQILPVVNKKNREVFDCLIAEKNQKSNRFYSNSIKKILSVSENKDLEKIKSLTNQKNAGEYRFEDDEIANLFVDSKDKEPILNVILSQNNDNKPRFSAKETSQILKSSDNSNLKDLKTLMDFKVSNELLLANEIETIIKRINLSKKL
jgi:hypothetical protein